MTDQPKRIEDMTADELREELRISSRREYDLNRHVESLLMGRARWERNVTAAIRRREWEQVAARDDLYARYEVSKRMIPLDGVLYRVEQLGERASAKQVAALKDAVRDARHLLSLDRTKPDTALLDGAYAEIERLRQVIAEQARALHEDLAAGEVSCHCGGCELIRAMDAGAPSIAQAVREVEEKAAS